MINEGLYYNININYINNCNNNDNYCIVIVIFSYFIQNISFHLIFLQREKYYGNEEHYPIHIKYVFFVTYIAPGHTLFFAARICPSKYVEKWIVTFLFLYISFHYKYSNTRN